MPELPEAEHARRVLERVTQNRCITAVDARADEIVFASHDAAQVARHLRGRRVLEAKRWGKYLWLVFDVRPALVLHLGMTGTIRYRGDEPLRLASSPERVDRTWPPRFTKLHLTMDDGGEWAFTNARRFGRLWLQDEPRRMPPIMNLGFDPWLALPSSEDFHDLLARRKGNVKGLLLNQKFVAGVGNWIADEVLYQAAIDPRRRVDTLSAEDIAALHEAIRTVIAQAVAVDARKVDFPKEWLFHRRWGKDENATDAEGHAIVFETVAGRTTAWVPQRQS